MFCLLGAKQPVKGSVASLLMLAGISAVNDVSKPSVIKRNGLRGSMFYNFCF
jgi:hypothetical protein